MTTNRTTDVVDNVLQQLKGVSETRGGWKARCPAHDDKNPSLSISVGKNDCVLLHCHAGCTPVEICAAIGMKTSELFTKQGRPKAPKPKSKATNSTVKIAEPPPLNSPVSKSDIDAVLKCWTGTKTVYAYHDVIGGPFFYVVRIVAEDGSKTYRPLHVTKDGKIAIGDPEGKLPLYQMRSLLERHECWVVEGEACAEAMRGIGMITTTSAHGASSAAMTDWTPLEGMTVNIIPDDDRPGRIYAQDVANILGDLCCKVRIVTLPVFDQPDSGLDIADFIAQKRDDGMSNHAICEELDAMASAVEPEPVVTFFTPQDSSPEQGKPTTAAILLMMVEAYLDSGILILWSTPAGDAYTTFTIDFDEETVARTGLSLCAAHAEHWPVRSIHFRRWLMRRYWRSTNRTPARDSVEDVLLQVEGEALWGKRAEVFPVCTRYGATDTSIFLDLADDRWRCVEITPDGWDIVTDPPVKFRRCRGMQQLPEPQHGGTLETLRDFINVDDDQFVLVVAWLVGTLLPGGPYPILELDGEQGSAKTTTCSILRRLIDPNEAGLRSAPRDEHDLVIAATNAHVIAFDNLSGVPTWLSDGLCRIATGAGFATRKLYSDADETIFSGARPIMSNGIGGVAVRPDLLDRTIRVILKPIPENQRRKLGDLMAAFDKARPKLLGALLDAASMALRRRNDVVLKSLPRMADFAHWIVAAEPALPWASGKFLTVYATNRKDSNALAIEASAVGAAILALEKDKFTGTATELLALLNAEATNAQRESKGWPRNARSLSSHVRRISSNLRRVGLDVEIDRDSTTGKRQIRWKSVPEEVGNLAVFASLASGNSGIPSTGPETPIPSDANQTQTDANDNRFAYNENRTSATANADPDATDGKDAKIPTSPGSPVEVGAKGEA